MKPRVGIDLIELWELIISIVKMGNHHKGFKDFFSGLLGKLPAVRLLESFSNQTFSSFTRKDTGRGPDLLTILSFCLTTIFLKFFSSRLYVFSFDLQKPWGGRRGGVGGRVGI